MSWLDFILGRRTLRRELDHLRREVVRLHALAERDDETSALRTITGLEDQVIQLGPAGRIEYVNSSLASSLGAPKDALVGTELTAVDRLPWGPGVLTEVADKARASDAMVEVERRHTNEDGRETFHKVTGLETPDGRLQLRVVDLTDLRNLEQTFARYVSPKVVEKMKALPARDFFRAERTELTVLFGDLRGFTHAAQQMSAIQVRNTLNEYLSTMIDVADRHEAFVDKVIADEVMLLFGAPMPDAQHAVRALHVGLEMLEAQDALCARWKAEGRIEIGIGIGINTGPAVVGNIGSRKRMDYTVIGHAVNVASRLCDTARPGELLISEATRAALEATAPDELARLQLDEVGPLTLKGVETPVRTYSTARLS